MSIGTENVPVLDMQDAPVRRLSRRGQEAPGQDHATACAPAPRGSGWGHVSEFGSRLSAAAADRLIGAQNETYPPIWKRAQAVLPHSSMLRMKRAP